MTPSWPSSANKRNPQNEHPANPKLARLRAGHSPARPGRKTRATAEARGKKGHFYRALPTELRRGGFTFRQIAREGDIAIYSQSWDGCDDPNVCFEVIRIRRREGFHIAGRFAEPAEVYPSAAAWGTDGFTFRDKDAAFAKLRQLA